MHRSPQVTNSTDLNSITVVTKTISLIEGF